MTPMPTTAMLPSVGPRPEPALTVPSRVNDAAWSLAMALVWIAYRTETAVSTIKSGRRAPTNGAIRELLSALRAGSLVAHGLFEGEHIPHPIETAVWANFEIVVKAMWFASHPSFMPIVIDAKIITLCDLLHDSRPATSMTFTGSASITSFLASCSLATVASNTASSKAAPTTSRSVAHRAASLREASLIFSSSRRSHSKACLAVAVPHGCRRSHIFSVRQSHLQARAM